MNRHTLPAGNAAATNSTSNPLHERLNAETARNIRRSKQTHNAISEIIDSIPRGVHLTAPEVHRRVCDRGLKVSLSTVYRTLNILQSDGNVSTIKGDHGKRYESRHSDNDHDHLICLKCGLTIEFTDALIAGFGKLVAERKGYQHRNSRFDIFGICSECKSKDEDHKIAVSSAAIEKAVALLNDCLPLLQVSADALANRKPAKALEQSTASLAIVQAIAAELETSVAYLSQQKSRPNDI